MTAVLLVVHVLAVVLAVGPVTVAASMFAPTARAALDDPGGRAGAALPVLRRICRVYAALGLFVPVFGLATALALGVLTDAWVLTSVALTGCAAAVLVLVVLPRQVLLLDGIATGAGPALRPEVARLGAATGIFNALWVVVLVLMIVRPGSTTGV